MTGERLCDYPGCDKPATHYAQAKGANTPLKEWFGCADHPARGLPGSHPGKFQMLPLGEPRGEVVE